MRIDVLTLFPELFEPLFASSILGRAQQRGLLDLRATDIRSFASDRHRTVDDTPYGGGPGMVLRPDVLVRAIESVRGTDAHVVLLTPVGTPFTQAVARDLATRPHLVLVAGHYEGYDERVTTCVDRETSLGDFVLMGGEAAAWALVEATARLVPGVILEDSARSESFEDGILEAPQYTRPAEFRGMHVPEVLLTGDHEAIRRYRRREALRRTLERRPDLLEAAILSPEDRLWIQELAHPVASDAKDQKEEGRRGRS